MSSTKYIKLQGKHLKNKQKKEEVEKASRAEKKKDYNIGRCIQAWKKLKQISLKKTSILQKKVSFSVLFCASSFLFFLTQWERYIKKRSKSFLSDIHSRRKYKDAGEFEGNYWRNFVIINRIFGTESYILLVQDLINFYFIFLKRKFFHAKCTQLDLSDFDLNEVFQEQK